MEHVEVARMIDASADEVWAIVGDFGNDRLTGGYVDRVEVRGEGVGAERIYHLVPGLGGGQVIERLEEYNKEDRSYQYRMTDNGPIGWTGYTGRITVTPAGLGRSAILFQINMTPITMRGEEAVGISLGNIGHYIENLKAELGCH